MTFYVLLSCLTRFLEHWTVVCCRAACWATVKRLCSVLRAPSVRCGVNSTPSAGTHNQLPYPVPCAFWPRYLRLINLSRASRMS